MGSTLRTGPPYTTSVDVTGCDDVGGVAHTGRALTESPIAPRRSRSISAPRPGPTAGRSSAEGHDRCLVWVRPHRSYAPHLQRPQVPLWVGWTGDQGLSCSCCPAVRGCEGEQSPYCGCGHRRASDAPSPDRPSCRPSQGVDLPRTANALGRYPRHHLLRDCSARRCVRDAVGPPRLDTRLWGEFP